MQPVSNPAIASSPVPEAFQELSAALRQRQHYIDFRLLMYGRAGRQDIEQTFQIAPAGATRDFAIYRTHAPGNIVFQSAAKVYERSPRFSPMFAHDPLQALAQVTQGYNTVSQGAISQGASSQGAISQGTTSHSHGAISQGAIGQTLPSATIHHLFIPDIAVVSAISRGIFLGRPVAIAYQSEQSPRIVSHRVIVPHALVDDGTRWHVRAYCRKREAFRDFILHRMSEATLLEASDPDYAPIASHEHMEADHQWTRIEELTLIPHPHAAQPSPDWLYDDAQAGKSVIMRAAICGYMLRRLTVDCTMDHSLPPEDYPLALKDPRQLYGITSAVLAPGFSPDEM